MNRCGRHCKRCGSNIVIDWVEDDEGNLVVGPTCLQCGCPVRKNYNRPRHFEQSNKVKVGVCTRVK